MRKKRKCRKCKQKERKCIEECGNNRKCMTCVLFPWNSIQLTSRRHNRICRGREGFVLGLSTPQERDAASVNAVLNRELAVRLGS